MGVPTLFSPITELPPLQWPIFIGLGVPGATVTVCQTNTGLVVAQTTVDENGNWLTLSNQALPFGPYSISAYYDLNQGYAPNLPFHVGPALAQPVNAVASDNTPVLTSLTIVDSLRPTLTGTAPPGSIVVIDHAGGNPRYGTALADSYGDWELIPITDFILDANNWVELALMATDAAGNALSTWARVTLTVCLIGSTTGTGPRPGPVITSSTTVNAANPSLTGTATPGATVTVYQPGGAVIYGSAVAGATGVWTVALSGLASGSQPVVLAETDAQGAPLSNWTSATLTVGTGTGLQPGPVLTSSTSVNSVRPTLSGTGTPGAYLNVLGPGLSPNYGTVQISANGIWSLTLNSDLTLNASNQAGIVLVEADFPGNITSSQTQATLTVSTTGTGTTLPPGSPPQLTSSTAVNSLRPMLVGLAAPNASVLIANSGGTPVYGTVTASPQGIWSLTPPMDLVVDTNNQAFVIFAEVTGNQQTSAWGWATLTVSTSGSSRILTSSTTTGGVVMTTVP